MRLHSFLGNRKGSASAEMALVMPLLLVLMFGSFELGRYFLDEHVVAKAVRDGARFAALGTFVNYPSCSGEPAGNIASNTRSIVRTGRLGGTTPRLSYWPNTPSGSPPYGISIAVSCATAVGAQAINGIYDGRTGGAAIVTVTATVPYRPLFGTLVFSSLNLRASSQAAVTG